jgi:2',3'-cyclic-nucleotide 2'-phosphodiesterase/3'-nucleotidase
MKRLLAALAILTTGAACGNGSAERAARPFPCPPGMDRGQTLTLFHETHTHGNLAGGLDRPHDVTFARYAGLRNALRACLADPQASLFLGNGDDLSPELRGVRTDGRHTVDAFNAAGIDADTFGFGELNTFEQAPATVESLRRLRELVAASDFAWVSANVRDGSRRGQVFAAVHGARLWIVRDLGGVRVGITGLLAAHPVAGIPAVPPGLEHEMRVLDPVEAMRDVVPRMRAAGAQVVVALSHMSDVGALRVARSVKGIDAILGTGRRDAASAQGRRHDHRRGWARRDASARPARPHGGRRAGRGPCLHPAHRRALCPRRPRRRARPGQIRLTEPGWV